MEVSHDAITVRVSPEDYATARDLVEEYTAALGVDLYFQNFAEEITNLFSILQAAVKSNRINHEY